MEVLSLIGLNGLESEVYRFLVTEGPSTGYRVSHGLGKPTANVYKALDMLHKKGAVLLTDSQRRSFEAVPADKLFQRFEAQFAKEKSQALRELKPATRNHPLDLTVLLQNEDAVLSYAKTALSDYPASVVIACEYYSDLLADFFSTAVVMCPIKVVCSQLVIVPKEAFEFETLQIVADRAMTVYATGRSSSVQGFAARSHAISSNMHLSLVCQIGLYQVDQALEENLGRKQISRIIENLP